MSTFSYTDWTVICNGQDDGVPCPEQERTDTLDLRDGWWRDELRLAAYLGKQEMPQGGWTETVAAAEIDPAATMALIRRLAR